MSTLKKEDAGGRSTSYVLVEGGGNEEIAKLIAYKVVRTKDIKKASQLGCDLEKDYGDLLK